MSVYRLSVVYNWVSGAVPTTGAGFILFDYEMTSITDVDVWSAGVYAIWRSLLVNALDPRAALLGWQTYDLTAAGWPTAISGDLSDNTQCSGNPGPPSQNCVVIKRKDNLPGPSGRGRIYLSPFAGDAIDTTQNGDLIDPLWPAGLAIATQMKTAVSIGGGAGFPVIWHRATATATPVVSTSIQIIMCSRRSRRTWRFDDVPQT